MGSPYHTILDVSHVRRRLLAAILVAVFILPLTGCNRSIVALFNSDLDLNGVEMDSRSFQAMQDRHDGVANKMLEREQFPERRLAARGMIENRLATAGITTIAPDELIGIVVDSDLQPVSGATVIEHCCCPTEETTTDDHGIFRLQDYVADDPVQLVISKTGYSPRIIMGRPKGEKHLLIILGNRTCLEGIVTGPDNIPVKGARIIASCGPFEFKPNYSSGQIPFETISGDDGSYRLDVCSNRYDIKAWAPGVGVAHHTRVLVEPNQKVPRPIQLETGIRFEATVVDSETGYPFEGFVLYSNSEPKVVARSDAQGRLVLEDQFPGIAAFHCGAGEHLMNGENVYWQNGPLGRWWSPDAVHINEQRYLSELGATVSANGAVIRETWQQNFGQLTFEIKHGMKPVKIIVEQGVTITGIVSDPEGNPVEGATVDAALSPRGSPLGSRVKVTTDSEGCYRAVLPASHKNKYNLVVHDGANQEWRTWANGISKPLQTRPGEVIENIDLKLTVPGVIRGRITAAGKPVSNRVVYSHSVDGCENPHYEPRSLTADDGTFELKFLRPGKHYVLAEARYWPPESDPKGFQIVDVKAGVVHDVILNLKDTSEEPSLSLQHK